MPKLHYKYVKIAMKITLQLHNKIHNILLYLLNKLQNYKIV